MDEYHKLLNKTIVPVNLNVQTKEVIYSELVQYVNDRIPEKLYRFRSCTDYSLKALENDELWFSAGNTMNDDFDSRLYYDRMMILDWIENVSSYDYLKRLDDELSCKSNKRELNFQESTMKMLYDRAKQMYGENIVSGMKRILDYYKLNIDREIKGIVEMVQSMSMLACFCEDISSSVMWGHYADSSQGFALEYDFGKNNSIKFLETRGTIDCSLYPVLYTNERVDATEYVKHLFQAKTIGEMAKKTRFEFATSVINAFIPCPDEFMATKAALYKYEEWKYEKEWRLFYVQRANESAEHTATHKKPSAVYLGRRISDENAKHIIDIAQTKGIPVYKMRLPDSSANYRLEYFEVK